MASVYLVSRLLTCEPLSRLGLSLMDVHGWMWFKSLYGMKRCLEFQLVSGGRVCKPLLRIGVSLMSVSVYGIELRHGDGMG